MNKISKGTTTGRDPRRVREADARLAAEIRDQIEKFGFKAVCGYEKGESLRYLPGCNPLHAVVTVKE